MGYQEVFICGASNKDTQRIYEAMQRLSIRSQNDLFANLRGMTTVKKDIKNLKTGKELILITGDRMYSTRAYLDASNKEYTALEKLSIFGARMYPLDDLLYKDGEMLEYNDYFQDSLISNVEQQKSTEDKMKKILDAFETMQQDETVVEEMEP